MAEESLFFTYVAPFVGVLVLAVGIAAAVPGGYALIQEQLTPCGEPTIAVESPEETDRRLAGADGVTIERVAFESLAPAEREAFTDALDDPVGEAHVRGEFVHRQRFENGTVVVYQGQRYYATIVAENTCFEAAPLQFPLGLFAIGLGVVGVLTPPAYRKLVELEKRAGFRPSRDSSE